MIIYSTLREGGRMKWLSSIIVFAVASSGSGVGAQDAPAQARGELATRRKPRVAVFTLTHRAVRGRQTERFSGVVVEPSRQLAKPPAVALDFAAVNSNSVAVDQVKNGQA